MPYKIKPRKDIHQLVNEYQKELETFTPVVLICGPGPCEENLNMDKKCDACLPEYKSLCHFNLRERLRDNLRQQGCLASLFEENQDINYASMDEKIILRKNEVDIAFIIPNSMGSAHELGAFSSDNIILPKLRVLVPYKFHPFYGSVESELVSAYKELMADYGHVYPFSLSNNIHPDPIFIASILVSVYKRRKLLELTEDMDNNF